MCLHLHMSVPTLLELSLVLVQVISLFLTQEHPSSFGSGSELSSALGHQETPGIIYLLVIAPVLLSGDFTIVANLDLNVNGCKGLWVTTEMKVRLRSDTYSTYGLVGSWQPGVLSGCAVQQVVPMQKPIEGTEEGSEDYDVHWDGSPSGQGGEDDAPAGAETID